MANKLLALPFALLISGFAGATYVDDMDTIDAQIKLVNKRAELQTALQKSMGSSVALPKVLTLISDINGSEATVLFSSGRTRTIKKGDALGHRIKVISISHAGVEVSTPNGKSSLAFNNPAVTDQSAMSDAAITPSAPSIKIPSVPIPRNPNLPAPSTETGRNG